MNNIKEFKDSASTPLSHDEVVVIINGYLYEENDPDDHLNEPIGEPFWAAILVAEDKVNELNLTCESARVKGEQLDIKKFTDKEPIDSRIGELNPTEKECKKLKETYKVFNFTENKKTSDTPNLELGSSDI